MIPVSPFFMLCLIGTALILPCGVLAPYRERGQLAGREAAAERRAQALERRERAVRAREESLRRAQGEGPL